MNFHGYLTDFEVAKDVHPEACSVLNKPEQYYTWIFQALRSNIISPPGNVNQLQWEGQLELEMFWYRQSRPYFKIWPSISDSMGKLKLNVKPKETNLKNRLIAIRFPIGHEPFIGNAKLCSILTIVQVVNKHGPLIGFSGQYLDCSGERRETDLIGSGATEDTIQDRIDKLRYESLGSGIDGNAVMQSIASFSFAVHLLADDPSIIQPDVLADDRRRFDESTDPELRQRLIEKARRRGIVGWRIGEQYETIPHYRRPHPALYHVGKGRTEQRIVFRAGSIVHRQKMTQVPTGYLEDDGTEVEQ